MLTLDVNIHEQIVEALQFVHKNNQLPPQAPAGLTLANIPNGQTQAIVNIPYGDGTTQFGIIQMTRGQFTISGVSVPGNPLTFNTGFTYNHTGTNDNLASYDNALKTRDLSIFGKDPMRSALIILTSECCRSTMVTQAIQKLISSGTPFSQPVWAGLCHAFTTYKATCQFKGYNINADNSPWTALRAQDYIDYIDSSQWTGEKTDTKNNILAVRNYYS